MERALALLGFANYIIWKLHRQGMIFASTKCFSAHNQFLVELGTAMEKYFPSRGILGSQDLFVSTTAHFRYFLIVRLFAVKGRSAQGSEFQGRVRQDKALQCMASQCN